jgi:hypothetical protein
MRAPVTLEVVAQRKMRTIIPIAIVFVIAMLIFGIWGPAYASVDPHAGSPQVVHVTDDPGGSVGIYYQKYKALSDAGTEIHFHGICASACTIVLFTEFTGIKACADEGAIFAFHKPFSEKDGKVVRSKIAVRETRRLWSMWLEELPPQLRRYLKSVHVPSATEGDEQNTLLLLPASLLLPKCPVTVATQ